ncbi:Protein apterous [Eumeta japonica]|uniref:Protein apterous n=1 Tax=Eumeta variegata TaxID=151549 RepID=A0A4C2A3L6_EUMVA|nr:Protein apterous [Eumeta japonica]
MTKRFFPWVGGTGLHGPPTNRYDAPNGRNTYATRRAHYAHDPAKIQEVRNSTDIDITSRIHLNPDYLEMGFRGGGALGSASRTKRMRTSFKHHQLRTMKSYFAINHNPDAKDLKQLSQKTGLPKRVLQVNQYTVRGSSMRC